jgi:hypothetical protein
MNAKKIFIWEIGDEENLFYNIGTWPSKASVRLDWSWSKWYIDKDMCGGEGACLCECVFSRTSFFEWMKIAPGALEKLSLIQKAELILWIHYN